MRITNQLMSMDNLYNYQNSQKDLYDLNQKLSSGLKIQNSYDNSGIYLDGSRLVYEMTLLSQVVDTTTKASEFSKNSDKALNDFTSKLTEFKTKLIQAGNEIHDPTSREAIANELEGIKNHLINIANSSINGQFLFSGTALNTKPIDSLGNYLGNDKTINAIIGANQTVPYNLDGYNLFLGTDNDYNKIITTNVSLVDNKNSLYKGENNFVTQDNKIMDIIGTNYQSSELGKMDPDKDFKDPNNLSPTTFFIQGRRPSGETFTTKFEMTPDASVDSLLKNIGYSLGNDKDGKNNVVDVQLNNSGQIEITDLKNGNKLTDFHIFGITSQKSPETLKVGDRDIVIDPATHGDFSIKNEERVVGGVSQKIINIDSNDPAGNRYEISQNPDGSLAVQTTNKATGAISNTNITPATDGKLVLNPADLNGGVDVADFREFNSSDLEALSDTGVRDEDGNWTSTSTLSSTKNISENIANGRVHLTEFIKSGFEDKFGNKSNGLNYDDVMFEKHDNVLTGNVPQIIKSSNKYANDSTKLAEVAGGDLQADPNSNMTMNIHSKDGNNYEVKINFTDKNSSQSPNYPTLTITRLDENFNKPAGGAPVYYGNIYSGKYNETTKTTDGVKTEANDITYKQIGDIISMVSSGDMPNSAPNSTILNNVNNLTLPSVATPADAIAAMTTGITDPNTINQITDSINSLTFPLTGDLNSMKATIKDAIMSNQNFVSDRYKEYSSASNNASSSISVGLNNKGELQITDKLSSKTNIEVSIFEDSTKGDREFDTALNTDKTGSLFNFNSNNAISIDEPGLDIFKDLEQMIQSVRDGSYRADSQNGSNPRTTGIQGALKRIDHIADHINKQHAIIGSYTNTLMDTNDRATMLKVNVAGIKSEIMDADYGETTLELQQRMFSYQAMLMTTAKISQISLLNYM